MLKDLTFKQISSIAGGALAVTARDQLLSAMKDRIAEVLECPDGDVICGVP